MNKQPEPTRPPAPTPPPSVIDSSPDISEEIEEWLEQKPFGLEKIAKTVMLRHEEPESVLAAQEAIFGSEIQRSILKILVIKGKYATERYDSLNDSINASKRSIRKHVNKLEEKGVLQRIETTKTTMIEWSSATTKTIAEMELWVWSNAQRKRKDY